MAIIDLSTKSTHQQEAENIAASIVHVYNIITLTFQRAREFVWANPVLTPQEAFALFGPNAADLVKLAASYTALVATYTGEPPTVLPEGYSLTLNKDGTVTVNAPAVIDPVVDPAAAPVGG